MGTFRILASENMEVNKLKTYIACIDGEWYAFSGIKALNKVYNLNRKLGNNPKRLSGEWSRDGIKSVSKPLTVRKYAYERAVRNGSYGGELLI